MRSRTNFAPTARMIVVGLLGTYGTFLPNRAGVVAFVAAIVLLLVGMVVRRI